jgi:HPt (histidine-containing phosphotransfer) domain-containing protein
MLSKEKKYSTAGKNGSDSAKDGEINAGIEIEGVDVNKGLLLSGGAIKQYAEILAIYSKDGLQKINEIRECLETKNTALYTVYVHGLKSASANIGAEELSDAAKALEAAGERGDLDFIEKHNGKFIAEFKKMLDNINASLFTYNRNNEGGHELYNAELLGRELEKLKTALDELNIEVINEATGNLHQYMHTEGIGAVIKEISECVLIAEYDMAAALIETALKELG